MRSFAAGLVIVACAACAPPDAFEEGRTPPDITTFSREVIVHAEVEAQVDRLAPAIVTLSLDERVVWSCTLESSLHTCEATDVWYQGPGLYTFAMGDAFAADVYVHDEVVRVELRLWGGVDDDDTLDLHANARAFSDGAGLADLQRSDDGRFQIANQSGVEIVKDSMTAQLERWDGDAWTGVPHSHFWLCGTGWTAEVGVDEVDHVRLPMHAYRRGMAATNMEIAGTYRVRFPFRVIDEEQPRLATTIMELDDETFGE